jgi:hypothetical protein
MIELVLGIILGGMAFTEKGHEIGNKVGEAAVNVGKTALENLKKKEESEK